MMSAIKILSVDDEAPMELLIRQYFRRKIRNGEYEFYFAHNGMEALDILNSTPDIEIILLDINMPEMDGLTLLAMVNEMHRPALRVIMVSAYGDMTNIRQAMNNGAFDFAMKPIDMDDLSLTIEKAIGQINYIHQSQKEHSQLVSLKKDLTTARDIQQYILPQAFPPFPEETDRLDIYASMEAAKDIGGDFYDFFHTDDDHIAFVIGDVCGKGIPAALFMAVSRTVIRSRGMQSGSTRECMSISNNLLAAYSIDCMFVTVFYAIYNPKTGLINYCNAGHNPPLLLRSNGTVEELPRPGNTMLGVFVDEDFMDETLQLDDGDTLVMFTDGVTEAMNSEYEEFGIQRLKDLLSGLAGKSSQQIVETIKATIKDFENDTEQSDDITMLVIKRK
jgi:sigma-B regulation protein RsbU (phosphoserine phosphatase)